MDSDWLTGLLVVFMVTIAVGLLWSGTMFGSGHKPTPIIIETPAAVVETKENNKKKPRQRTNPQQSPKVTIQETADSKESTMPTSNSSPDVTENVPSRSPRKKKTKAAKRDEMAGDSGEAAKEMESTDDGMWQTQLSRQQKQELLRQRRQQEQENTTQSSSESASPPEESIEKQIAIATDEVVTTSNNDSKNEDQLMYMGNNDDADAWLVINEEKPTS